MAVLSDPTQGEHHDGAYDALMEHVTAKPAANHDDRTAKVCTIIAHCDLNTAQSDPAACLWCACVPLI